MPVRDQPVTRIIDSCHLIGGHGRDAELDGATDLVVDSPAVKKIRAVRSSTASPTFRQSRSAAQEIA